MTNKSKQLTGYPSIDEPWLKYYSESERSAELPKCSIYQLIYDRNKERSRWMRERSFFKTRKTTSAVFDLLYSAVLL